MWRPRSTRLLRCDFDGHEMDIRVSMDTIWTSKTTFLNINRLTLKSRKRPVFNGFRLFLEFIKAKHMLTIC